MKADFVIAWLLVHITSLCLCQQPEPEPETKPEPEAELEERPGHEEPPFAEPEPDWDIAKPQWGILWQIHVYAFGALFGLIALYSLLSTIRLWRKKHLFSQPYFISLNVIVFLMATARSLYLLIDAYNSRHIFPHLAAYILFATVFPCLTSAFSLLFLAMLAATKQTFMSKAVSKISIILPVIVVHFLLTISADIIIGYNLDARILLFVCQMFYLAWSFFLFLGFILIFRRLYRAAKIRQELMNKHTMRKLGLHNKQHASRHRLTLSLGTIVTLISAIMGLLTAGLLIYGMADVYGIFSMSSPEPWRWFGYHTAFRTVELTMCFLISYIATQPFRVPSTNDEDEDRGIKDCIRLTCGPCWSWFQCKETSYLLSEDNWSRFDSNGWKEYERDDHVTRLDNNHVTRQDSGKGDFPLHHIRRTSGAAPSPKLPRAMMLTSNHGQLNFSKETGNDGTLGPMTVQNPNFFDSHQDISNSTLKIDRELSQDNHPEADDTEALLTSSDRAASREDLDRIVAAQSMQSIASVDNISQMSPRLELSDDESLNDHADV